MVTLHCTVAQHYTVAQHCIVTLHGYTAMKRPLLYLILFTKVVIVSYKLNKNSYLIPFHEICVLKN